MTPTMLAAVGQVAVMLAYAGLGILAWRGRPAWPLLPIGLAAVATSLSALLAVAAASSAAWAPIAAASGIVRDATLVWLLWTLFDQRGSGQRRWWRRQDPLWWCWMALLATALIATAVTSALPTSVAATIARVATLGLAVLGLILIENAYAAARADRRWAIKHLLIGLGMVLAYGLFMHTEALLLHRLSDPVAAAQPFILLLAAPFVGIGAARLRGIAVAVPVARDFVVRTTALVACGAYLVLVALGSWLVNLIGLEWGPTFQILLLTGAAVILLVVIGSNEVRARIRRAIERAFYSARYDYRTAWLRFVATLEEGADGLTLHDRAIRAVTEPLHCAAGLLLLRGSDGNLHPVAQRSWRAAHDLAAVSTWPTDLADTAAPVGEICTADGAAGLPPDGVPDWLTSLGDAWIVLGLRHHGDLIGVMILGKPQLRRRLGWEDHDLLQLLGSHVALLLAEDLSTRRLAEAQKFDRMSRHFSFVAHDLKNLISQLSLIVGEASRLRDNREFIDDALITVAEAVGKMRGILLRLRDEPETGRTETIDIRALVEDLIGRRGGGANGRVERRPMPDGLVARADRAGLAAVLENLVGNAQDAVGERGRVEVAAARSAKGIVLEVADDGPGMTQSFVTDHLFVPFASTKDTGFGLGMYQCRLLVERWGGRLEVDSAPGCGTRVRVVLPVEPGLEAA